MEKKQYGNYTKMLGAFENQSWKQQPPQKTICMTIYFPSHRLNKKGKQDKKGTAWEIRKNQSIPPTTYKVCLTFAWGWLTDSRLSFNPRLWKIMRVLIFYFGMTRANKKWVEF